MALSCTNFRKYIIYFYVYVYVIAIDALPTLQISVGFIALFEKISYGEPIFTVISNNGEDVQYRCFN